MNKKAKTEAKPIDKKLEIAVDSGVSFIGKQNALDISGKQDLKVLSDYIKHDYLAWTHVKSGIQLRYGWDRLNAEEKIRLNNNLNYLRIKLEVKARSHKSSGKSKTGKNKETANIDNPDKVVIPDSGKTQKSRLQVLKQVINAMMKEFSCNSEELQELLAMAFSEVEEEAEVKKVA